MTKLRHTMGAAALGLGAAGAAQAHYVWLERDGNGPGRACFGYFERDLRERSGGALDVIAAPRRAPRRAAARPPSPGATTSSGSPSRPGRAATCA